MYVGLGSQCHTADMQEKNNNTETTSLVYLLALERYGILFSEMLDNESEDEYLIKKWKEIWGKQRIELLDRILPFVYIKELTVLMNLFHVKIQCKP